MFTRFCRTLLFLLAGLTALPGRAQLQAVGDGGAGPYKAQHLTVELTSFRDSIAPGETIEVGVVLTLEEKWHISWINAGESGEPPHITWTVPKGITAGPMQFPTPTRFEANPLTEYGYENAVAFPTAITAAKSLDANHVHLDAQVTWMACGSTCVPGRAHLGMDLPVVAAPLPPGPNVGALGEALTEVPKPLSEEMSGTAVANRHEFVLTLHTGSDETDAAFFPLHPDQIDDSDEQETESIPGGIRLHLKTADGLTTLPKRLDGVVKISDTESYVVSAPVTEGSMPAASPGLVAEPGGSPLTSRATWLGATGLVLLGGVLVVLWRVRRVRRALHR